MTNKRPTPTKTLFVWFLLILAASSVEKEACGQVLLTPSQMRQDLGYVADLLRRVHPEPFHAVAEADFEDLVGRLSQQCTSPLPREDFFFILRELTNALKDGHTEIQNTQETSFLPVRFYWAVDGLVVTQAQEGSGLEVGDKILALGGNDPSDLLDQLAPVIATDNVYWLRDRSADLLSRGSFLRHLQLVDDADTVQCLAEDGTGHLKDVRVGLTPNPPPSDPASSRPFYGWHIDETHSLGVFYLDQCIFNTAYQSALQDFFQEVRTRRVEFVAFDVRRNPGGDSRVADELLRYMPVRLGGWLVNSSLSKVRGFLTDIRFSPEAASQRGYSQTSGYRYADLTLRVMGTNLIQIPPLESVDLVFHGQVVILTSGHTASSANLLATLFQDNHLGSIVGEPTGSKPSYFGDTLSFKTPNSQFNFIVSHKKFYRPDYMKDSLDALFPDFYMPTLVDDLREGRDAQMSGLLPLLSELSLPAPQVHRSLRSAPVRSTRPRTGSDRAHTQDGR